MCTAAESQLNLKSIIEFQKLRTVWWAEGCPKKLVLEFGSALMGHPTAHQKVLSLLNSMMLCNFSWNSKTFCCSAHCSTLMQELTRCYIYKSASYLLCLQMDFLQLHVCRRPDEGDSQWCGHIWKVVNFALGLLSQLKSGFQQIQASRICIHAKDSYCEYSRSWLR